MKNTTFRLKQEQIDGLKTLATKTDRKPAEIFRYAVDEYLRRNLPRSKRSARKSVSA